MKTIYVDDMFVLNLIINYFILLATAKLCALPLKRWRFALAAALGALYAVLILLPPLRFLASPIAKVCLGITMTLISFGGTKKLLQPIIAFFAVSAAFGGAVFAASMLAGTNLDDGLYINASMRVLVLSFAICYFALTIVFNRLGKRRARTTATVKLSLNGKTAEFKALHDTGNELFDPVSGLPVMVADVDALISVLKDENLKALKKGAPEFIASLEGETALLSRFWLVPYSAVGLGMALLPVFKPDTLTLDGRTEKNLLVGISPNKLCESNEFSAVI